MIIKMDLPLFGSNKNSMIREEDFQKACKELSDEIDKEIIESLKEKFNDNNNSRRK